MSNEIQILVMTHGNLGRELIKTAAMFVPQTETIGFIGLYEEDSIVVYQEKLSKLLDHSKDLLILTDMLTATTPRIAIQTLKRGRVEIISGINLIMLITAHREKNMYNIDELCELVHNIAKQDIVNIRKHIYEVE